MESDNNSKSDTEVSYDRLLLCIILSEMNCTCYVLRSFLWWAKINEIDR